MMLRNGSYNDPFICPDLPDARPSWRSLRPTSGNQTRYSGPPIAIRTNPAFGANRPAMMWARSSPCVRMPT